jgi:hypothetical protein
LKTQAHSTSLIKDKIARSLSLHLVQLQSISDFLSGHFAPHDINQ